MAVCCVLLFPGFKCILSNIVLGERLMDNSYYFEGESLPVTYCIFLLAFNKQLLLNYLIFNAKVVRRTVDPRAGNFLPEDWHNRTEEYC